MIANIVFFKLCFPLRAHCRSIFKFAAVYSEVLIGSYAHLFLHCLYRRILSESAVLTTRLMAEDRFGCYEDLMKRHLVIWPPPRPVSVFDSLWESVVRFFGSLAESLSLSSDSSSELARGNYQRVDAVGDDQEIQQRESAVGEPSVAASPAAAALSGAPLSPTAALSGTLSASSSPASVDQN